MARTAFLVVSAALISASPSAAQITTTPPAAGTQTIPEKQSPNSLEGGRSESLSTKLSRSGGVITPQTDTDPKMHVPAPDPQPNSTPVIPPSATGGNTAK